MARLVHVCSGANDELGLDNGVRVCVFLCRERENFNSIINMKGLKTGNDFLKLSE